MKFRPAAAFVLMLCMLVFAVCFGAYQGWSQEKARLDVPAASLNAMILTRAESAYNLMTVARRHLPENDEAVESVRACWRMLADEKGVYALAEKARASETLTAAAEGLLARLSALDSVKQDSRDSMYVQSLLPQMLRESQEITVGAAYNQAAAQFNRELRSSYSGMIAMLFGVAPAQEFIAE